MKREYKIGEEFRVRCVEDRDKKEGCDNCCFAGMFNDCQIACVGIFRSDKKNVHFEIVNEK